MKVSLWCPETQSHPEMTLEVLEDLGAIQMVEVVDCERLDCPKRGKGSCYIGKELQGKFRNG